MRLEVLVLFSWYFGCFPCIFGHFGLFGVGIIWNFGVFRCIIGFLRDFGGFSGILVFDVFGGFCAVCLLFGFSVLWY